MKTTSTKKEKEKKRGAIDEICAACDLGTLVAGRDSGLAEE